MSNTNVNFSINNLPQIDGHFNDAIRIPDTTQAQNTEHMLDSTARKLMMPVEVTHTEQEITDPNDHKPSTTRKKKKKIVGKNVTTVEKKRKINDGRHFLDIEV